MYKDAKGNQVNALVLSQKSDNSEVHAWVRGFKDHFNTFFVANAMGIAMRKKDGVTQTAHPLVLDSDGKYVSGDVIVRSSESYSIMTKPDFEKQYTEGNTQSDSPEESGESTDIKLGTYSEEDLENAVTVSEQKLNAARDVYKKNKSAANKQALNDAKAAFEKAEQALEDFID